MLLVTLMTATFSYVAEAISFDDIFGGDEEQGLSFTEYEGTLGSLDAEGFNAGLTKSTDLKEFVITIVNFALGFLGLLAVIIVIYGGVLYVTAAGEEEKTQKGKKSITYATVGLLIVLGSFAFVNTVIDSAGGGGEGSGGSGFGGGGFGSESRGAGSFNAIASQLKSIATDIYNGFEFLSETTEEFKNIEADSHKRSLYFANLPSQPEMKEFLYNVQSSLKTMNSKLPDFSKTEAELNKQVRKIDQAIDLIGSIGGHDYLDTKNSNIEVCNASGKPTEEIACFEQIFTWQYEECKQARMSDGAWCEYEGYQKYPGGEKLARTWQVIHRYFCDDDREDTTFIEPTEFCIPVFGFGMQCYPGPPMIIPEDDVPKACMSGEPDIEPLDAKAALGMNINVYPAIVGVVVDYQQALTANIIRLNEIWEYIKVIEAIEGNAQTYYLDMMENYQNLLAVLSDWGVDTNIASKSEYLLEGLRSHSLLYEEVLKIEFVKARLVANVAKGNAPLTVVFNIFDTYDPAGGSVIPGNIVWDPSGMFDVADMYDAGSGLNLPASGEPLYDLVDCDVTTNEEDNIGKSAIRCTFKKPGEYNSAVMIHSNVSGKYGPGISVLPIEVTPPDTLINLQVYEGLNPPGATADPGWVSLYDDDYLSIDRQKITFTASQAANKITFDAKATDGDNQYKIDYGDGTIESFSQNSKFSHEYTETGRYPVAFEVENELGVVDRKLFILNIDDVSARVSAIPSSDAFIDTVVTFDGSGSRSDVGGIRQYEWTIIDVAAPTTPVASDSGATLRSFSHEFEKAGEYDINLKVTSDGGNSAAAALNGYIVHSKEPVAQLDYNIEDDNQPALVVLDATRSYDPDGKDSDLTYDWTIDGEITDTKWQWVPGPNPQAGEPIQTVKFLEKGNYNVEVKVSDINTGPPSPPTLEEFDTTTAAVIIDDLLDIAWDEDQVVVKGMNTDGEAEMEFLFSSENAVAYEISFGDEETSSGELNGSASTANIHTEAGKYMVNLTVYDENDEDKTISKRIFIGGGKNPLAKIRLLVNDADMTGEYDGDKPIELTKKDIIKFDATDSINLDGTGRDLRYSWDFGDTELSSKELATHSYDEPSPDDPGYYNITLKIADKDDPTLNDLDTIKIDINAMRPKFSAIQGLPVNSSSDLITPVTVNMQAYGAEDEDGQIVQYRWWYFDLDDPDEPLGMQITESPNAQLVIGTRGKEGDEITYGFGLEVTDSDNLKFSSEEIYEPETAPSITVINGQNELPLAKFNVDSTKVFTGEKIRFTSASNDPDGNIIQYIWDIDGDGFYNDEPVEFSTIEHIYEKKNLDGYDVRLKVVDDKGGEAISDPVSIFVDSLSNDPIAAFKYEVVPNTDGKKIKFLNNARADEEAGAEIISYEWDFDTASDLQGADSDGDGLKDNDVNSKALEPVRLYNNYGTYYVKLTVTDDQGNTDSITNELTVPLANPPVAAFKYEFVDGQIAFKNNSTSDLENGANIIKYEWDFDTSSNLVTADSDGDGQKDNDVDSVVKNPAYEFLQSGIYNVKLTVFDDQGNEDSVTNPISIQVMPGMDDDDDATELTAVLQTIPAPAGDDIVYLNGEYGSITFNFTKSEGSIAYYSIDKNIYFDTDGDGIKNNDADFKTQLPGTWKTNFEKVWGKTISELTVVDIHGNEDKVQQEIKFK